MTYKVRIIADAKQDIRDIYNYLALFDSESKAEHFVQDINEKCQSLSEFPNRGHFPPELERIGIFNYREIHYKPYRIIYQVFAAEVHVNCILDGRRELQALLEKRLLRA